jgi:hypothetical protein
MNRPEFITKDSRIIISENNLKIVGQVTEPLFDTDQRQKMILGGATGSGGAAGGMVGQGGAGKKRRMSNNQHSGELQGVSASGQVGRPNEEAKIAISRTPLRNPESIISDEEENPSDFSRSEGRQKEKKTSKTRKPLKTALSLDPQDDQRHPPSSDGQNYDDVE